MRTRWIASLVSLSLASGHGVCAQEALWFTPSQPAAVAPEATAEELSFSQRFGGLLSRPGHQTQPATPAIKAARSDAPQRGAQVAALAPQVKANYVKTPTQTATVTKSVDSSPMLPSHLPAKSLGIVDRIPWQTHVSRPTLASESKVQGVSKSPSVPKVQTVSQGPARASIRPNAPARVEAAVAQKPESLKQSDLDRLLADSLIQPIPQEKLNAALLALPPQVEHPSTVASVPKNAVAKTVAAQSTATPAVATRTVAGIVAKAAAKTVSQPAAEPTTQRVDKPRAVTSQLTSAPASPHYTFVDIQQSTSALPPVTVVPAPAVTNRLTDQAEFAPGVEQVAQSPVPAKQPAPSDADGLLSTQAMIGPLQGAEQLFGRLNIREDLRDVADRIESGPRGDSGNFEWMPAAYTWISPAFYHYPLYFEQPNLERYGLGPRPVLKPLASSIHFFGSIPLIPYKTLTHHPRERVYTLGNMRPGNCVPVQRGVILGPSTVGEVTMFWEECSGY